MSRPRLEVADILRTHGAAWRHTHAGHLSLGQLKVMSAIEQCRSVALGGHVLRCADCATTQHAYNSCRNRHCPSCEPPRVTTEDAHTAAHEHAPTFLCPACGAAMIIIETFERGHAPRAPPSATGPPCRT